MGEPRTVVRTTISVPRDLKARMDAVTEAVNWSGVAAKAFENKLLELASRAEEEHMDEALLAQLRAAKELDDDQEYKEGHRAGVAYAKRPANIGKVKRIAKYLERHETDYNLRNCDWWDPEANWMAPFGASGYFALEALGRKNDHDAPDEFWTAALGEEEMGRVEDGNFLRGFGEGVVEIWNRI